MNLAIIQARMGSTRLPGKMMLPLAGNHVIECLVQRVSAAETVDEVVVATTDQKQDDILQRYAKKAGAAVYRGDKEDVLGRMYNAAEEYNPELVVRIAGDRPLLPPACIDAVVEAVHDTSVDYASNVLDRTFPRGFEAEAFTFESFEHVQRQSTTPQQREHVTPYYRKKPEELDCINIKSDAVFDTPQLQNRTELRLTLDEADDYELLRRVYENNPSEHILSAEQAIQYIDKNNLTDINKGVSQKRLK